jgi:hypothetical protein
MLKSDDVNKLMGKMRGSAENETQQQRRRQEDGQKSAQLPRINLTPYKLADAWPGRNYALVGNSHYVEKRIISSANTMQNKRAACIAMMLEQGGPRRCVFVTEALQNDGFIEVLSRFERDWLYRLPPHAVLGPAYNANGNMIEQSFAVWSCVKFSSPTERELAPAGST